MQAEHSSLLGQLTLSAMLAYFDMFLSRLVIRKIAMARSSGFVRCGLCGLLALLLGFAASDLQAEPAVTQNMVESATKVFPWQTDYGAALESARQQKTMVVVWFCDLHQSDENVKWELAVMGD